MAEVNIKPFHEWKDAIKKEMKPLVMDRYWYYQEYGNYCKKARVERPEYWETALLLNELVDEIERKQNSLSISMDVSDVQKAQLKRVIEEKDYLYAELKKAKAERDALKKSLEAAQAEVDRLKQELWDDAMELEAVKCELHGCKLERDKARIEQNEDSGHG